MEDEDSDIKPPAGITFAIVKDLNLSTGSSMTTDMISKPYNQNKLQTHSPAERIRKRFQVYSERHRSRTYNQSDGHIHDLAERIRKRFQAYRERHRLCTYNQNNGHTHDLAERVRKRLQAYREKTRLCTLANSGDLKQLIDYLETCPDIETIVNRSDDKGKTALHFAASQGYDQIVHELLKHGANPSLQDFNGNTPLHLAACTQHVRVVTLLIHFGADVSKKDTFGKTPLHVSLSRLRMLQAKPFVNTSYGAAKRKADVCEIVAMLQEYFDKSGQTEEQLKLSEINKKLMDVHTYEEVDEVGSLLFNFTQMNIDVEKR